LSKNHYHILQINSNATAADIKKAYRLLAKRYHPDYNPKDETASEKFLEITIAYETLSNSSLRTAYDKSLWGASTNANNINLDYYLHVTSNASIVKCCEEFELTFTYSGDGRYLKKPPLSPFVTASKPYVDFRQVNIKGYSVKETCITYTLSAPVPGNFKIGAASIKIQNKTFQSVPLYITAEPTTCFYTGKNLNADGSPLKFKLYHKSQSGSATNRFTENLAHTILIPRSQKAQWLHNAGSVLKIVFAIWGGILAAKLSVNILAGFIAGSVYGAACCYALYYFNGVHSKFFTSHKHPVVKEYVAQGFKTHESMIDGNQIQKVFSYLIKMLY